MGGGGLLKVSLQELAYCNKVQAYIHVNGSKSQFLCVYMRTWVYIPISLTFIFLEQHAQGVQG
jgi:hypothetical protein